MAFQFNSRRCTPSPLRSLQYLFWAGVAVLAHAAIEVENAVDEGQECWKISTPTAIYFYHKEGAGFSSLLDRHGNDWLSYHPWGTSDGKHRGIPNMVFQSNGNFFHPGHEGENGSDSELTIHPDRVTIVSTSANQAWQCKWEIFETHATMTVTQTGGKYWFLYEGTPGGGYDPETDWYEFADGIRRWVAEDTVGDIPDPEWIAFGAEGLDTVLALAHQDDDAISDTYMHWENMTVFGFGRAGREDYTPKMDAAGERFTIALIDIGSGPSWQDQLQQILAAESSQKAELQDPQGDSVGVVTDIDGNRYETLALGSQIWMQSNLRTTRFNDGTVIPALQDADAWVQAEGPASCSIPGTAGERLYNGYAATHPQLCPQGWRIATDADWKALETFLGLDPEAAEEAGWRGDGAAQLASAHELWAKGALKEHDDFGKSGFDATPAGNRIGNSGSFGNRGTNAYFWTSSLGTDDMPWVRMIYYGSTHFIRRQSDASYGMSVRCVKDR